MKEKQQKKKTVMPEDTKKRWSTIIVIGAIGTGIWLLLSSREARAEEVEDSTSVITKSETSYYIPPDISDESLMDIMFPPDGSNIPLKKKLVALDIAMQRLRQTIG